MPEDLVKQIEQSSDRSMEQALLTLNSIKGKRKEYELNSDAKKIALLNVAQFTLISQMDFGVILKRYFHADLSWELNFNSRVFALTLYEFMNGITSLMNKEFHEAISSMIKTKQEDETFQKILYDLREFRKTNEKTIKYIRHNVIAHKDSDAKFQLEIIESINHGELMQLNLQIFQLISKFHAFLSDISFLRNTPSL